MLKNSINSLWYSKIEFWYSVKKFLEKKTTTLILGGISILVIVYLSASLGSLELKPARPFTYLQQSENISPGRVPAWNGLIYIIVLFAALLIVIFFLLSPDQRKKFLWAVARLALAGFLVFLIFSRIDQVNQIEPSRQTTHEAVITPVPIPTESPGPEIILAEYTSAQVSPLVSYLVALGILLVGVGVWWWLIWRRRDTAAPFGALAEIARSALNEIETGKDWGDAILNSYYRMNSVVADWRGIHRQESLTPTEFAALLISTHLPAEAVNRLTRLFERVRYGDKKSTPQDVQEAVDCFTTILNYCQDAK
jgi:hypothetical protein